MKKLGILFLFVAALSLISCKDNKQDNRNNKDATQTELEDGKGTEREMREIQDGHMEMDSETEAENTITVNMSAKSGSDVKGEVHFSERHGAVLMEAKFSGLDPNGTHAIHLHEIGDCSSEDGMSTKGHWNPTEDRHGKWEDSEGYHRGDIGNLEADENGKATLSFESEEWCIDCDDEEKNIIGKSIIVHADADDFESQPTGDAGDRISCGEIK